MTTAGAVLLLLAVAGSGYADPDLPVIPSTNFNVLTFGAYGNGSSNNAGAIQSTINAANAAGGGTVEIPADGTLSTYLSGPITMKSSVNLQIDAGAMLQMQPMVVWTNKYGSTTFILGNGSSLHDMEITGSGTIDGQGAAWWNPTYGNRPNFIEFDHTSRVLIQGVTLQNPPTFHIMVHDSNGNLTIQNITINTSGSSPNTDGIDLASTNVLIRNCFISDGDDNIQIGSSSAAANNITVSNCTFGTGHGVSIGSPTQDGVNNLLVSNCTWNGTEYGIKYKTDRGIGGTVQNLQYRDLVMSNVNFAIAFYMHYNAIGSPSSSINVSPTLAAADGTATINSTTPFLRNVTISNLTATSLGGNITGILWGYPETLVSNVTLTKVNIIAPTKTFCVYNSTGIQIIDSNFTAPNTSTNTFTIYNAGMTITNSVANTNLVTLCGLAVPPTNNVFGFFNGRATIASTNVLGAGSITLGGSTLSFSQGGPVTFSNNIFAVSASTLVLSNGTDTLQGALTGPGPLAVTLTNSGALRFNQGANVWGGSNAIFNAGSSGTINNHAAGSTNIFLGALTGGSGSTLRGSDQNGPGVDTYVIGNLSSNTTFAGTIADGTGGTSPHVVALVEVGTGTFTLLGANSYSGSTTVSNGTLFVDNTTGSATGTGAVTVVASGTLGGTGVVAGPVSVSGTLSPGDSPGTLTVSNNLAVNSGAVLQYQLGTNSDLTVVSGNLTLGDTLNVTDSGGFTNTTYTLFTYGGTLTYNGVTVNTTPNPGFTYTVSTNTPGQVNLIVSTSCSVGPAGSITGSNSVNAGDSGVTYSISSVGGANNYTWTVPSGASITSGQGTTSITVNYSCGALSDNVAVTPSNGSCSGTPSSLFVTVNSVGAAGLISGPVAVCPGQTSLNYSISSVGGATTYVWTVPSDATITGGQGTTSITVTWGSTAGNVTVTPSGANGCTGSGSGLSVAVNAAPSILSSPSPQTVCDGGSASFTVSASGAGLSYQWQENGSNISDGGTIGGSATTALTLTGVGLGDSGASFDCVVSGTCSPPATSGAGTLTVNSNPAVFNVTGGGSYCAASGGVTVGLDGSESTADYLLELNGNPTGTPVTGTGSALSFTNQTSVGAYTVIASNVTSGCTATMNGSASVTPVDPFTCWEEIYGITNCALCDGNSSYTGDGMSNTNKFLAGFNPTNSAAYLRVISIGEKSVAGNTNVVVTYLGASGDNGYTPGIASRTNVLDYTTGTADGSYTNGTWQDTGQTNILGGGNGFGTVTNMMDVGGVTNFPSRYYRVRVLLP